MTTRPAEMTLVDHHGRKYLTADERQRFFAAVRTHRRPTVQTLASTLALTGCRISEALGLRACDVDLTADELRVPTLKRRKETWRAVPVAVSAPGVAPAATTETRMAIVLSSMRTPWMPRSPCPILELRPLAAG